nr:pentatricopeptide repeat-containing protein At1g60770 [Ipomoea batatas]
MASFIQRFSSKNEEHLGRGLLRVLGGKRFTGKLVKEGGRENSVGKNLNEFLKSQKSAYKWEVGRSVKLLRQRKLYSPPSSLMTLYTKTGQPEKIPAIIQEMKECDIMPDSFTYNIWMRALAALGDISGVERTRPRRHLKELEKKKYSQKSYCLPVPQSTTVYGRIGNLLEVYRIWRSLKACFSQNCKYKLSQYDSGGGFLPAVDCIEKAITTGRGDGQKWVPSPVIVGELMRHFETNKRC